METYRDYVNKNLYKIKGFMHPTDAMIFSFIMSFQKEKQYRGAHAEIGVFYGRSLSLMASDALENESQVLGLDLFDIPGQREYVTSMLEKNGIAAPVTLRNTSSLDLSPDDIINAVGPVRLFSVDGGHELEHIENDAALAGKSLSEEGVIAFDDFMNPLYPEVSRGVINFLSQNAETFTAFALTHAKLYVTEKKNYASYFNMMKICKPWAGASSQTFSFMENELVFLDQSLANRAIYQNLAAIGLGGLGEKLTINRQRRFNR